MQMLGNRRSGDSDGRGDDRPSRQQSAGGGGNGELRIPIVRDRSVQFDVITSSDSY